MCNKEEHSPANLYCKLYDVINHPQVMVHLLLCSFSFLASVSYRFAPLLLMDIATFSKTLNNVVFAAVKPYKELLMTLALALIIIFIYTSFGYVLVLCVARMVLMQYRYQLSLLPSFVFLFLWSQHVLFWRNFSR